MPVQRYPHFPGNDDLVVIECGHTEPEADHPNAILHEIFFQSRKIADGQIGLRKARSADRDQSKARQFVNRALAVRRLPADGQILIHGAARSKARVSPTADLIDGQRL